MHPTSPCGSDTAAIKGELTTMNKIVWLVAGLGAAALYALISKSARPGQPIQVTDLAHKLQDAWADHHTVA